MASIENRRSKAEENSKTEEVKASATKSEFKNPFETSKSNSAINYSPVTGMRINNRTQSGGVETQHNGKQIRILFKLNVSVYRPFIYHTIDSLHSGQLFLSATQVLMHSSWKQCLQGRTISTSSPSYSFMQIAHFSSTCPKLLKVSLFKSSISFCFNPTETFPIFSVS